MSAKQMGSRPRDSAAVIRRLYFDATPGTIQRDLDTAVELLKGMATETERERVAVYMDGLSQMRSEWAPKRQGTRKK